MQADLSTIALRGMTTGITMEQVTQAGWQLRKNKTFADVQHAFDKGKNMGGLKTEYEIDFTGLYLSYVLKKMQSLNV